MVQQVDPLWHDTPIVKPQGGSPSDFFVRQWNNLKSNVADLTAVVANMTALLARTITAGTGLTGGGNLSGNITLAVDFASTTETGSSDLIG